MLNPSQYHANCIQHTPGNKHNKCQSQQHITPSQETSPIETKLFGSLHYIFPLPQSLVLPSHLHGARWIYHRMICTVLIFENNTHNKDSNIPRPTSVDFPLSLETSTRIEASASYSVSTYPTLRMALFILLTERQNLPLIFLPESFLRINSLMGADVDMRSFFDELH